MKISVNDHKLFELSETQKNVIKNDIYEEIFEEDMKRRIEYTIMHKYNQCFDRLKKEWDIKLAERIDSVPTNKDEYANLVFTQPDYKNRSQRDNNAIH